MKYGSDVLFCKTLTIIDIVESVLSALLGKEIVRAVTVDCQSISWGLSSAPWPIHHLNPAISSSLYLTPDWCAWGHYHTTQQSLSLTQFRDATYSTAAMSDNLHNVVGNQLLWSVIWPDQPGQTSYNISLSLSLNCLSVRVCFGSSRVGIVGGLEAWTPLAPFMSTDAHFWVSVYFIYLYIFFYYVCARLSWSLSFWVHVKLFFRIVSYRTWWGAWVRDLTAAVAGSGVRSAVVSIQQ